jgi:salicylate hydroxylase
MPTYPFHIAIVGGGIGGLTTALALRQAGFQVDVFEQASRLKEVGAGVDLGPNAVRLLFRLGLEKQLAAITAPAVQNTYRRWNDGQIVESFSRTEGQNKEVALSGGMHRAELLDLLLNALPQACLHTGKHCIQVQQHENKCQVSFADGSAFTADVLLGADGIHSVVRKSCSSDTPVFSGQIAYRGLIPMERLTFLGESAWDTTIWMGPDRHFLLYPISQRRLMNLVAFVPARDDWRVESWSAEGNVEDLVNEFTGWDRAVVATIHELEHTMRWALYDREPLERWSSGAITLLGDAAHAMLPHQGQGAGQSIEDAIVLTRCLQEARQETLAAWLQRYEALRKPRATFVQQTSRISGEIYDWRIQLAQRRHDLSELRVRLKQLWTYDAEQAFSEIYAH